MTLEGVIAQADKAHYFGKCGCDDDLDGNQCLTQAIRRYLLDYPKLRHPITQVEKS